MKQKLRRTDGLILFMMILLAVISVIGLISFHMEKSNPFPGHLGGTGMLPGGMPRHASFYKETIYIGSDIIMLFMVVPMLAFALIGEIKKRSAKSRLFLASVSAAILYCAVSIVFGMALGSYLLLYIALIACSLFALIQFVRQIDTGGLQCALRRPLPSKGLQIFLILSGIFLSVTWLPGTLTTFLSGKPVSIIELYTTEIIYVLNVGVIAPLIFLCLYLLHKKEGLGVVLLALILKICAIIGVMIPLETFLQLLSGIERTSLVFIVKIVVFAVLAAFAVYFDLRLYKNLSPE